MMTSPLFPSAFYTRRARMLSQAPPQHFLNFLPLPHGQGSFRPASIVARTGVGAGSRPFATSLASGSRLCLKNCFSPEHR